MTIPSLSVALLSPGGAQRAAALFAEGQLCYNEPSHKDLLHVCTRCKTLNPVMPLLLGCCHREGCERCAVRWCLSNVQLAKVIDC